MTEPYEHWTSEQLELAIEYRERVLLGEVERLYPFPPNYLQEFGHMITELASRPPKDTNLMIGEE